MKTRQLGKDGPKVSGVCFGGLPMSGTFGAIAPEQAHATVREAIVGAKTPEQVRHNARAADWKLTQQDLEEIEAIQGDLRLRGPFSFVPVALL